MFKAIPFAPFRTLLLAVFPLHMLACVDVSVCLCFNVPECARAYGFTCLHAPVRVCMCVITHCPMWGNQPEGPASSPGPGLGRWREKAERGPTPDSVNKQALETGAVLLI